MKKQSKSLRVLPSNTKTPKKKRRRVRLLKMRSLQRALPKVLQRMPIQTNLTQWLSKRQMKMKNSNRQMMRMMDSRHCLMC
jgi:hypothetical protein